MATYYFDTTPAANGYGTQTGNWTGGSNWTTSTTGASGTNVVWPGAGHVAAFGSSTAGGTATAGTITLNSAVEVNGLFTGSNLTGATTLFEASGTYVGQIISGSNTLTFNGAATATNNGSGDFTTLHCPVSMTGSLAVSTMGLNISCAFGGNTTGSSGMTGTINLTDSTLKAVHGVNGQVFFAPSTVINQNSGSYFFVQRWTTNATQCEVKASFTGNGNVNMQGDMGGGNNVSITGSLAAHTGNFVLYGTNTLTVVDLPTACTTYFSTTNTTTAILNINAAATANYLSGTMYFQGGGNGGRINSIGQPVNLQAAIVVNDTISPTNNNKTLILGGTTVGSQLSGNVSYLSTANLTFQKVDAGTWIISGNNSAMSTGTTISGGALRAANNNSALGSGAITVSGAALELSGGITLSNAVNTSGTIRSVSGANTISSALTIAGTTTIRADAGSLNLSSTGTWTVGSAQSLIVGQAGDAGNITIAGLLPTNINSLTKNGSATLFLNNAGSTFTGGVTLNGGTTQVSVLAASGAASPIGTGSSVTFTGDGLLLYTGSASVTFNRSLTFTSATGAGFQNSGTGTLTLTGAVSATNSTIALAGSNTGFNRFETAIPAGANGFAKSGAGRWVVAGANNITGSSPITGGTLVAANATFTSKLVGSPVVSAGAKLQIAKEGTGKARCTYGSLSMGGVVGTPARMRIGGIATSPTVLMSTTLYLPTAGPNMTWDLTGDTFKVPGTYTLVEFSGVGDAVGGSGGNVLAFVTPTVPTGRTYSNFQYNSGASPKTITIQIS